MEAVVLKEKLIAVLCQIQADSSLECPELTGATKPVIVLPKFNSEIWPVATTILATEIGLSIPADVNIFFDAKTKQPCSIDESVAILCESLKRNSLKAGVAA